MKIFLYVFASLYVTSVALAQPDLQRIKHFNTKRNLAAEGYDVTSYFDNKPIEGLSELTFTYKGVNYQFASRGNLNKFKLNPGKYEPAYGGWCAYAMGATGEKIKVDPETYKILKGKLYFFYNFWGNNTLADWNENEKELKLTADHNWKKLINTPGN
jgi:YHS domain-containing protein